MGLAMQNERINGKANVINASPCHNVDLTGVRIYFDFTYVGPIWIASDSVGDVANTIECAAQFVRQAVQCCCGIGYSPQVNAASARRADYALRSTRSRRVALAGFVTLSPLLCPAVPRSRLLRLY